ncbi:MAG: cache domain-containing protein, partial [Candidatus Omnitrophica bacterium]|nr:cache domain-containing protein [Candidatus Omnitrophota bacterium]
EAGALGPRMKTAAVTYDPARNLLIAATEDDTDFRSVGLIQVLQEELKGRIAQQRILGRGYVWVINSDGMYIVSKGRMRDGENILGARNDAGVYFVRDIIHRAHELGPEDTFVTRYVWRNGDDNSGRTKTAVVGYDREWGWVVGAGVYEDDFLNGLAAMRWHILGAALVFLVLGSLAAYALVGFMFNPLRTLQSVVAKGDLDAVVDERLLALNDEIGQLAQAFAVMMRTLNERVKQGEVVKLQLLNKNEEIEHAHRKLLQSTKMAAIGQLAAGVAHEINNPLAFVMSNLETLERYVAVYEEVLAEYEKLDAQKNFWRTVDEARQDLADVARKKKDCRLESLRYDMNEMFPELRDGLNRVKHIVTDLRAFSRTDQEMAAATDVTEVIEKVLTIVWNEIKYKAVIKKEYGKIPQVRCHAQRLGQVFMNVLVNAAHAVEAGKGVIRIRTSTRDGNACIEIEDNGCGIAPEHTARIFEPFFTTKPTGEGTGLGLSLSYDVLKKYGGDIHVVSEVGKGSTFTIILPAVPA